MVDRNINQENGVLASLSPETLEKLADLVVAKLAAKNDQSCFPSNALMYIRGIYLHSVSKLMYNVQERE